MVKFADKERHQVFIEPEGLHTNEMYIGGMSSSLPEDVQYAMYRSVPGLENVKIVRNAYAIEYDCIDARQLLPSLEFREISGLFSGGQFNGSSGYEEAAAQGLIAGINAARKLQGKEPVILDRSEAYIGVLIDDLVTKESKEPYRMMTSRAEYRLLLRQDNADQRLTKIGYEIGLIPEERYQRLLKKEELIEKEIIRLKSATVGTSEKVQNLLVSRNSTPLSSGSTLAELIRRPEISYKELETIDEGRPEMPEDLKNEVIEQIDISIKYEGYISRQKRQVEQFKKLEKKKIPEDIDYDKVKSLRIEAVQKLRSTGQSLLDRHPGFQGFLRLIFRYFWYIWEENRDGLPDFRAKLGGLGIKQDQNQLERFHKFYQLLIEWNKVMNLTGYRDEDVVGKTFCR